MRNIEDIMADYIASPKKLSANEERLLDRKVYEKTGKHIDKFKDTDKKKPKDEVPSIVANGGAFASQADGKRKRPKDIPRYPGKSTESVS